MDFSDSKVLYYGILLVVGIIFGAVVSSLVSEVVYGLLYVVVGLGIAGAEFYWEDNRLVVYVLSGLLVLFGVIELAGSVLGPMLEAWLTGAVLLAMIGVFVYASNRELW